MENELVLQWGNSKLPFYWHYNFIYKVYKEKKIESLLGFQDSSFYVLNETSYEFYLTQNEIEYAFNKSPSFFYSEEKYDNWKEKIYSAKKKVDILDNEQELNIKDLTEIKEVEETFVELVALHLVSQPHNITRLHFDLKVLIEKKYDAEHAQAIIEKITMIDEMPDVLLEQNEWKSIIKEKNKSNVEKKIYEHYDKWKYITAGDSHEPLTINQLCERYNIDIKNRMFNHEKYDIVQVRKNIKSLESKIASSEIIYIAKKIREISFLRFLTKQMWMKVMYILEINLKKYHKINNIKNGFDFISEELEEYTNDLCENNRSEYYHEFSKDINNLFYNGTEKSAIAKIHDCITPETLKGMVSFKGKESIIHGTAYVIGWGDKLDYNNFTKFSSSQILVLPQTTPSYVPILNNFDALLVDEGGIAGHASIISREFKIPSIVGCGNATKYIKTGDKLIVDMNKGVIEWSPNE